MQKEILGIIAVFFTFASSIPYIKSILLGKTKPHFFTWLIWTISTAMVFCAQISDNAGAGAWAVGFSVIITAFIAFLSYLKKSDIIITRNDKFFLLLALSAIPVWYITANPLWFVILITVIDVIAYIPTLKKSYIKPFEELLLLYILMIIESFFVILALENYSLVNSLYTVAIIIANIMLIILIFIRRLDLKKLE